MNSDLDDSTASTDAHGCALASDVNAGPTAPARGRTIGKNAIRPPTTTGKWLPSSGSDKNQPSPHRPADCAMAGLGLGAGLTAPDLKALSIHHVEGTPVPAASGSCAFKVPAPPGRRRPRLRGARPPGPAGLRPGALLLGRDAKRRNVTAHIVADAVALGTSPPHIEQARLRSHLAHPPDVRPRASGRHPHDAPGYSSAQHPHRAAAARQAKRYAAQAQTQAHDMDGVL